MEDEKVIVNYTVEQQDTSTEEKEEANTSVCHIAAVGDGKRTLVNNIISLDTEKFIYNKLSDVDAVSTKKLEEAKVETNNTSYEGLEPIDIEIKNENYIDALSPYNLNDEDAAKFIEVITEFKDTGSSAGLYDKLPKKIKELISGFAANTGCKRTVATKTILESFITDAERSAAVDQYNIEMKNLMTETNTEYANIYNQSINELFDKIDEIREQDPEKAKRVEAIKHSFDDAKSLDKFLEWCKDNNPKKYRKRLRRFNDEVFYFNNKISKHEIKIANLRDIPMVLSMYIDNYSIEDISIILIAILTHIESLDLSKLETAAYGYKLLDNLYSYRFKYELSEEENKLIDQYKEAIEILKK